MITRRDFLVQAAATVATATVRGAGASESARLPGTIQTVQGAIDASKLGFTLPHEHICASSPGFWQAWPEFFGGRAAFVGKVVDKLKAASAEGVDTIVDVTPIDVGRDIRLIEEVSKKSGMQIVACTGHWLAPSASMAARTADELAEFFVLEIERGIEGTDIKPGVIKVATDQEGVTPFLEGALRAAARASIATGVPVTTHTFAAARVGEKQADLLESEGLNPKSVCLGHCDDTADMEYLTGLLQRGFTIGMDHLTWGAGESNPKALHWQQRAQTVKKLIDAGFCEQIFLSNDWYFGISMAATATMRARDELNPDGMLFTSRQVIPYLKHIGVTQRQVHTMTVSNPQRFFGRSHA
jgi:phosphotriesterase-related protein